MKSEYINYDNDDINGIIELIKKRVRIPQPYDEDLNNIVWELIERVLNLTIGEITRNYKRQSLVRVNTIAFRTELAVKSETKRFKIWYIYLMFIFNKKLSMLYYNWFDIELKLPNFNVIV